MVTFRYCKAVWTGGKAYGYSLAWFLHTLRGDIGGIWYGWVRRYEIFRERQKEKRRLQRIAKEKRYWEKFMRELGVLEMINQSPIRRMLVPPSFDEVK